MSIFSAMNSGVSGLAAQSAKFGAISDNISNSSTVGYKRSGVQFATLVTAQATPGSYSAGGVTADIRTEVSRQGLVQRTVTSTDVAIAGRGFFVVANKPLEDSNPSQYSLTRAGSFRPDENGNLRNTAGFYLQGWRLDDQGNFVGGEPSRTSFEALETVNLANLTGIASRTSRIDYAANLPAARTGVAPPGPPISTAVDYFTPLGDTRRLTLEWQPSATANQWTLTVLDDAGASVGTVDVAFNDGSTAAPAGSPATYAAAGGATIDPATGILQVTVDGFQTIDITLGPVNTQGNLTQFGDIYEPRKINKDGAGFASLERVEVGEDGIMTAVYRNGLRQAVYRLPLADVTNPDGLTRTDGNTFLISRESGSFYLWDANTGSAGTVEGSALELSNVDIAEELTSIIETQRAYSSNAKIIQTADEMLDEITRLTR